MRCRYTLDGKKLLDTLKEEEREKIDALLYERGVKFVKEDDIKRILREVDSAEPNEKNAESGKNEAKEEENEKNIEKGIKKNEELKDNGWKARSEEKQEKAKSEQQTASEGEIKAIIKREAYFKAIAKEYDAEFDIDEKRDVTNKSRTKGTIHDFVKLFQNRFQRISSLFTRNSDVMEVKTYDLKKDKFDGENVFIIAMVSDKRVSKNGNIILDIEDLNGKARAIISAKNENLFLKAEKLVYDTVAKFEGRIWKGMLMVEDFSLPGLPLKVEPPKVEKDVAVLYLSDLHFGSRYTIEGYATRLAKWLKEPKVLKEMASRVKYIVVAGDVIDGVGIYPGQERELIVKDAFKQYELFDKFVESIPDYIEVFVAPGNHDAVRRGEPMPAIPKDSIQSRAHRVGNPSYVTIEGYTHLMYHGTSFDSMIASVPGLSYLKPEMVMKELLERRHLSPIYGTNPIIPEHVDYLVLDKVPHVFHTGHVHTNGQGKYRGIVMINSGTFQGTTPFQKKLGHVPTPGKVPYLNLHNNEFKIVNLNEAIA